MNLYGSVIDRAWLENGFVLWGWEIERIPGA